MANATFDNMWSDAMNELDEQLHVEGVEDDNENPAEVDKSVCFLTFINSYFVLLNVSNIFVF